MERDDSPAMASQSTGRQPLTRATIVAAGVALADEAGVPALSMRKLARRLGYEVMSLYNHVRNKDELLGLMVDAVAAEIEPTDEGGEPLESIRQLAMATRAALVRHAWAADQWLRHLPGPARTDQMEAMLTLFARSNLAPDIAHHGFHAVTNHVLGYTLQEQSMSLDRGDPERPLAAAHEFLSTVSSLTHPHTVHHVHQHLDGNTGSSFELVLDLILDGLERLDRTG